MRSRVHAHLLATVGLLFLGACSSVKIVRVNDQATQPEGIPFFLPRPYVQVFEPFVIGSKAYLVSGTVSPDGKFLLIDNVSDKGALDGLFRSELQRDQQARVEMAVIRPSGSTPSVSGFTGGAQGGADTSQDSSAASAPTAPSPGSSPTSSQTTSAEGPQPSGNFSVSVTNTDALFPATLGRRFFDVVWMPDFEEKYVVQGSPGLGNANIGITMTQGWGLYGLDSKIDNSALARPLLNFYSTAFDALGQLARSKISPAGQLTGGAQGSLETASLPPGSRVTVKVTRVQVVAPGLYPILKPAEVALVSDPASTATDLSKRHLPQRPYTNIAFNTYEVVVVEAARPSGDTPMNLQRYFDQAAADGSPIVPVPSNKEAQSSTFNATDFETKVNALLANRKGSGGEFWKLSGLRVEGMNLVGIAHLSGGTNKPTGLTNMVELGTFVAKQEGSRFLPGQVKLTEAK